MEYDIRLIINKEDGFVPVKRVEKVIEDCGGEHKYSFLREVKDGDRLYVVKAIFDEKAKNEIVDGIKKILEVKHYEFCVI